MPETEFDALESASGYFTRARHTPQASPLFKAWESWKSTLIFAADATRLGGPPRTSLVEESLVSFLLVWRMALDHLGSATSSRCGKGSPQWEAYQEGRRRAYDQHFGYRLVDALRNRVQHQENPPLTQTLERHPYGCSRCGEEHENLNLSVSLPSEWLLSSDHCPRILKRDLVAKAGAPIDMRSAVEDSMRGFESLLFTLILSEPGAPAQLEMLVRVFRETSPMIPCLVRWWAETPGGRRRTSLRWLDEWAVARAEQP